MDAKVVLLVIFFVVSVKCDEKVLKQVVILSRHNVRTPLAKNLGIMTPKPWPRWKEKSGYLTQKGALLEGYMGTYFSAWLNEEKLLPNRCPNKEEIYVYANVKQRTRASAQAFVKGAFPGCNVTVHHNDSDKMDPIFNPVIHNNTSVFIQIAIEEMQQRLKSLQLNSSYEDIANILDYKNSEICKKEKKCDLITDLNKIINIEQGLKPNINGPLKISNSAIDAFIMEFYEGFENVAWGLLSDVKKWDKIMQLSRGYHNVIFNTSLIAKDISKPLVDYMSEIFLNNDSVPKVILLMGHDANMYTVLNGIGFKPYTLPHQEEITPVGGKIVFQRWYDVTNKRDLLKINYVYQSRMQLRNGEQLSLKNPPQYVVLELENCKIDSNGFCLWKDFVKILNKC
ncbi:glucose-1-phosphatase-like [Pectinophora gossypiella]|uniref:glucose-1-phosphatase-like n=1 Tax=Pectinophora gossypiella TaxID=13191 RepID=UPI00214E701F|nr:glucose-1-phosphatase-like [Pectinophora gossypiella]